MLNGLSIKMRLYINMGLALMVMLILTGVDLYSVRQGSGALESVYEHWVVPTSDLMVVDADLKDLRFRMAAYLVDQMPAVGNVNQLKMRVMAPIGQSAKLPLENYFRSIKMNLTERMRVGRSIELNFTVAYGVSTNSDDTRPKIRIE